MAKSDLMGERGCQPPRLTQIAGMGALSNQNKRSARMKGAIELDKLCFRVVMYSSRHYLLLCYLVLCLQWLSEPEDLRQNPHKNPSFSARGPQGNFPPL
jgi:hypothetical protein